jgi:hypothetical protein
VGWWVNCSGNCGSRGDAIDGDGVIVVIHVRRPRSW